MLKELYKYRAFNNYSLESLSEGVIWVSKPTDLNIILPKNWAHD